MKKKNLVKMDCFQHAFICLQLKLCFISINVPNDYCKLSLLYPLVYLIITIFHVGYISKRQILEMSDTEGKFRFFQENTAGKFKN